jgi:hypothetical protein
LSLIATLASGCTSGSFGRRVEPPVVIVRNLSGVDLAVLSLRVPGKSGSMGRIGAVSPVRRGTTAVFTRPSSPPPLPNEVEVSWTDHLGGRYSERVSLRQALREATGEITEALVFEIGPSGSIEVYCERSEPRP